MRDEDGVQKRRDDTLREKSFVSLFLFSKKNFGVNCLQRRIKICVPSLVARLIKRKKGKKEEEKVFQRRLLSRDFYAHTKTRLRHTFGTLKVRLFLVQTTLLDGEKEGNPFTKRGATTRALRDERVRGRTRSGKERVNRGRRGR